VADYLSKLAKFLDQLLPFLESSPAWLRTWIHLLIILNFLTIAGMAVAYLTSKEKHLQDESLQRFSVDQPAGNEEIPLGANRTWMLVGKLPVVEEKQDPVRVTVEVLKLPDRVPFPQEGIWRPNTVQGFWRFESAKFPGQGSYEIVATIARGSLTLPRIVQVKCVDKAAAYRDAVELGREVRGAVKLPEKVADVALPALKDQLAAMDYQFRKLYQMDRDLPAALQVAYAALDCLDPVLPLHPDDYQLQNYRAYFLKDYAMVMLDMNRTAEAESALGEAKRMFSAIREQKPDDPSAWNGLGSVAALQGDYHGALYYIDQALAIQKDYSEALSDREMVLNALRQQEQNGQSGKAQ